MTAAFRNVRQKELCDHTMWFVNLREKEKECEAFSRTWTLLCVATCLQ